MIQEFLYPYTFQLESGQQLEQVKIAYTITGNIGAQKTVWVCHALSGSALVTEWWGGLFGAGKLFDPNEYRIICANAIGSCYGSTGPDELDSVFDFPLITIKDLVKAHVLLRNHLKIQTIDVLIGASLGGQQALEWAIQEPENIKELILIATNAEHSPFGKAFNETQRLALLADPTFGKPYGGFEGLKAARAIAMLSYRSYRDFEIKQQDKTGQLDGYNAPSYVKYQGEKFTQRFGPGAYYTLSKAMDSHDIGRGRTSVVDALQLVKARTLVVGIDSDLLFPLCEQQFLVKHLLNARLEIINSPHGHDAFLINYDQLEKLIKEFLLTSEVSESNSPDLCYARSTAEYFLNPTKLKPQLLKNEN